MIRPIKFRGKRIDNGKWVYSDLLHPHTSCRIVNYDESENEMGKRAEYRYFDVEPNTIGQFTGLRDKKGKEIYEGDIVKFGISGMNFKSTVEWDLENGRWRIESHGANMIGSCFCNGIFEIVGNTHDDR